VTHDKFFIVIETTDPKYSEAETRKLLEAAGSQHIEMWRNNEILSRHLRRCVDRGCLVAGKRGDTSRKPPIEVFPDMDRQLKLRPQTPNGFFANGLSSQLYPKARWPRASRCS